MSEIEQRTTGPLAIVPEPKAAIESEHKRHFQATPPDGNVDAAKKPGIWQYAHSVLRGRYVLLSILGLVVATAVGGAAWRWVQPTYTSEGLVRIAYTLPPVFLGKGADQNEALPMFDTFMMSQKQVIGSRRVIDMAIQDPGWRASNRPVPADPDGYFSDHLLVDIRPRSELIRIAVSDRDAVMAATAATAVVNAYQRWFVQEEQRLESSRLSILEERQTGLKAKAEQVAAQIREKAKRFGTTKPDYFYEAAASQAVRLKSALDDVRLAQVQQSGSGTSMSATQPKLSEEQFADRDPVLREYLNDMRRWGDELKRLAALGQGEASASVRNARTMLAEATESKDERVRALRAGRVMVAPAGSDSGNPRGLTGMTPAALQASADNYEKLFEQATQEMVSIGNDRLELERMETELSETRSDLEEVSRRIEALRGQDAIGGRLTVIGTGEVPLSPSRDQRRKYSLAAAGAGFCLPAAAMLAMSLLRRRYRYADETTAEGHLREVPMLGLLPEVSGRREDPELMLATAHNIHHARVLLCSQRPRPRGHCYLVTSATEGEGKTSLTVALSLSFAAARQRTLLIDGDFVGRRVTNGFGADDAEGFYESIRQGEVGERVCEVGPSLFLLPAGRAKTANAAHVTAETIRIVLDSLAHEYDAVLIDTGPVLGSLEAVMLAQEVSGVILTISRGQHQILIQNTIRRLHAVGACIVGAVFNRARLRDFHGSVYSSSSTSVPCSGTSLKELTEEQQRVSKFGPVVRAVALAASTVPVAA